jgi:hypothetical protein
VRKAHPVLDPFTEAFWSYRADQERAHAAILRADEWEAAARGEKPVARKCSTLGELARFFQLAGVAAGAIARSAS